MLKCYAIFCLSKYKQYSDYSNYNTQMERFQGGLIKIIKPGVIEILSILPEASDYGCAAALSAVSWARVMNGSMSARYSSPVKPGA